jgi:signal transduction histidine kinase
VIVQLFAAARGAAGEDPADENAALRRLARQMAATSESPELLSLLCETVIAQCAATSAGVVAIADGEGKVVAASGGLASVIDRRFSLAASLANEAIRSGRSVRMDDFHRSSRPLARLAPHLDIGPMLASPLIAHGEVLGVLVAGRQRSATAFGDEDARRMQVIADYAALALWKADLLERAQAADRAKGRFLATISHELRTPLTALTGYEELLADQVIGPLSEPQLDVLERMRSVTHHLTAVIEEVLAYSSIEDGREVVRTSDFLAADLVRAAVAITDPLAAQKGLPLVLDIPEQPIRLCTDIDKVRQILVNLMANAVKFTDEGQVNVTVTPRQADARDVVDFAVADTGIGMTESDVRRLFRPFVQLDAGLTRRHGGTGLGLYISQRLAELLGGRITVASQLGVGSRFTLTLPADLSGGPLHGEGSA